MLGNILNPPDRHARTRPERKPPHYPIPQTRLYIHSLTSHLELDGNQVLGIRRIIPVATSPRIDVPSTFSHTWQGCRKQWRHSHPFVIIRTMTSFVQELSQAETPKLYFPWSTSHAIGDRLLEFDTILRPSIATVSLRASIHNPISPSANRKQPRTLSQVIQSAFLLL